LREWPRLIVSEILAPEVRRRDRGQTRHATAMKRIATLIGSMLLLSMGLVRDARAQATGNADVTPLPSQGLYWNPREHGIYYHLSVGPDGYGFVAITLFRPDGEPTFLVMQGPIAGQPADSPPGTYASLRSPLFRMRGGQTLGGPYSNPRIEPASSDDAELLFAAGGLANFRHEGRSVELQQYPLYTQAAVASPARYAGRWLFAAPIPGLGWRTEEAALLPQSTTATSLRPQFLADGPVAQALSNCNPSTTFLSANNVGASAWESTLLGIGVCRTRYVVIDRDGALIASKSPLRALNTSPDRTPSFRAFPLDTGLERFGVAAGEPLPWVPAQGLYWNPLEHGTYYNVSVGPDGYALVAITLFDNQGEPTFLIMQGPYESLPIDAWRRSLSSAAPTIGRLRSPLYRMQNGQCLGCPHREPQTLASEFGTAEIEFGMHGQARFLWRGNTTPIERFPLYASTRALPEQRVPGRWAADVRIDGRRSGLIEFDLRRIADDPLLNAGILDGAFARFGAGELFRLRCTNCTHTSDAAAAALFRHDPLLLGVSRGGRHELFSASCSNDQCLAVNVAELHARDALWYARFPADAIVPPGRAEAVLFRFGELDPG
jgi:hypothetical protein